MATRDLNFSSSLCIVTQYPNVDEWAKYNFQQLKHNVLSIFHGLWTYVKSQQLLDNQLVYLFWLFTMSCLNKNDQLSVGHTVYWNRLFVCLSWTLWFELHYRTGFVVLRGCRILDMSKTLMFDRVVHCDVIINVSWNLCCLCNKYCRLIVSSCFLFNYSVTWT